MPDASTDVVSPDATFLAKVSGGSSRVKTWDECRALRSQETFAGRLFVAGRVEWRAGQGANVEGYLPGTIYRYELSCREGEWHVDGAWSIGDAHLTW
jgi:hypothetical protein